MLDIQLTADDYVAANLTHTNTRASWLRSFFLVAALLAGAAWFWLNGEDGFYGAIFVGYAALLALVIVAARFWLMPRRVRRVFAQTKSLQRPFHWSWNEEALSFTSDLASAIVPWADMVKWREGKEVFLIYPSDFTFYVFPKRAFAAEREVDSFRSLLRTKIATRSPAAAF